MTRREFLIETSAAAAAMTSSGLFAGTSRPVSADRYTHRVQFGCWINDMRNDVLPRDNWPAKVLDDKTERDIIDCLTLGQQSGYNQIDVWGLFATSAYPIDLRSAFRDEQRRPRVDRI